MRGLIQDFKLSFLPLEKLELEGYRRISSRRTFLFKYVFLLFFSFILIRGIITFFSFRNLQNFSMPDTIYMPILYLIVLILFVLYISKIVRFKNVFLSKDGCYILIFLPYKNRIESIDKNRISYIEGSMLIRTDIIKITTKEMDKEGRFFFLGTFRLIKAMDEHPIVKEIKTLMKLN